MKVYPVYPTPLKTKLEQFLTLFKKGSSWIDLSMEKSYTMKMGQLKMPGMTLYFPNEPELIQKVMMSEVENFPKNSLIHEMLKPLLGESIFTTNGKVWKKQREMLNPSFEMVRVANVFDLMNSVVKDMNKKLALMEDGEICDVNKEMNFVTADIIFRTILSSKLSVEDSDKIIDAFEVFQEKSTKIGILMVLKVPKFIRDLSGEKERLKAGKTIRTALAEIIKPRYDAMICGEKIENKDILASILSVIDKDTQKPFSFVEILDQISMLFLAGHETSASSLTWSLYLLSLYPEVQDEAYEELVECIGNDDFNEKNIKNLNFLTNVFKESLRLYPPVSFMPRNAKVEGKMRSYQLKKNAIVIVSPWLIQRNERFWKDAHMFNPHRFDNPKDIKKYTYFPFSLGQRNCIGAGFAMQEGILVLANILREYHLELKEGFTPKIASRFTLRSLNGMPIKFTKREKN